MKDPIRIACCVLAFTFLVVPMLAQEPPASLLAPFSPSCEPNRSIETPATLEIQEPIFVDGCVAELTCWGGNEISCEGTTNCHVNCGAVMCDSVVTECTCTPPLPCPGFETAYCNCRTCGYTHQQCFLAWCT